MKYVLQYAYYETPDQWQTWSFYADVDRAIAQSAEKANVEIDVAVHHPHESGQWLGVLSVGVSIMVRTV